MNSNLVFEVNSNDKYLSFVKRVLINTIWIIALLLIVMGWLYFKNGTSSLFITTPFSFLVLLYLFYYEYKKDYTLLMYLELNKSKSFVRIRVNKMDKVYLDQSYKLSDIEISARKVFSGNGGNPSYRLEVRKSGKLLFTQRANLVWSDQQIKEIGDQVDKFLQQVAG